MAAVRARLECSVSVSSRHNARCARAVPVLRRRRARASLRRDCTWMDMHYVHDMHVHDMYVMHIMYVMDMDYVHVHNIHGWICITCICTWMDMHYVHVQNTHMQKAICACMRYVCVCVFICTRVCMYACEPARGLHLNVHAYVSDV